MGIVIGMSIAVHIVMYSSLSAMQQPPLMSITLTFAYG